MRPTRLLLAALALLSAPGERAYAQFARSMPVRSAPVAPTAPVQLHLPAQTLTTGLALPSAAPTLTAPTLSLPTPSLSRVALGASPLTQQTAGAVLPAATAPALATSPRPLSLERESVAQRDSPSVQQTARGVLERGAAAATVRGVVPDSALDAFFAGAKARAANANAVTPSREPGSGPQARLAVAVPDSGRPASSAGPAAPSVAEAADKTDVKALAGLFASRTVSIASFILTSIAYPFLAVPVVGWDGFGALMAFGPLAALATGPLNGLIAQRLSARKAMALNAAVRAGLSLILPVAAAFGVLNFWTLLGASVANGWVMNSVMTTEGTYLKKLAGEKRLGTVNGLAWMNYLAIQVLLGLILGVGSLVDQWQPAAAFYVSAAAHALVVLPILWFTMPDIAPPPGKIGPAPTHVGLAARALAFFMRHRLPLALVAAAVGAYVAFATTLPLVGAILFWVARTEAFRDVWSGRARADSPEETLLRAERDAEADPARRAALDAELSLREKRLRHAMLYLALAALFLFPLQYFVLPAAALAIAGAAGKGLVLGQLLGALFLGNLISVAARSRLPNFKIPGVGTVNTPGLIEGLVVALAVGWSLAMLAPGSLPVAAAVAIATLGLLKLAARISDSGWIRLMGLGFLATALPFLAWTLFGAGPAVSVLLPASLLVAGMFYGPAFVALNTYFQRWVHKDKMGPAIGAQGSFFNGAISMGYGLVATAATLLAQPLPGLLGVLLPFFALGGLVFWLAPRWLPGLPRELTRSPEPPKP